MMLPWNTANRGLMVITSIQKSIATARSVALMMLATIMSCGDMPVVMAAPDDTDAPPPGANVIQNHFHMEESNFDQWIFQGSMNAAAGRTKLLASLKLKLSEIDTACSLTEAQKRKLNLAAQGDLKRFFDDVEVVRRKFQAVKNDQNKFNEIWQDIQPLQMRLMGGLFDHRSIFIKSITNTLTSEQQAKYRVVTEERRRFRYHAAIATALVTMESTIPLRQDQHEAMSKLLEQETEPPLLFGQYDYYYIILQLSRIPEEKWTGLFDERKQGLLRNHMGQYGGMEQHLIQTGVMERPKIVTRTLKSVRKVVDPEPNAQEAKPE